MRAHSGDDGMGSSRQEVQCSAVERARGREAEKRKKLDRLLVPRGDDGHRHCGWSAVTEVSQRVAER